MTRYYTNFEDSDVGREPTGWTRRWNAVSAPTFHSALVRYGTPLVKRRELRYFSVPSNAFSADSRAMWSMDAVDADGLRSNIEVLTLIKRDEITGGSPSMGAHSFFIWVRAAGAIGAENAFRLQVNFPDAVTVPNLIMVRKHVAGAITTVGADVAIALVTSKAYYVRFRVQNTGTLNTTQLQVRVWAEDVAEPSSWNFDQLSVDATMWGAVGWNGVGCVKDWGASSNIPEAGLFNFVSVGTNGDTAWKPKTNAEYSAWLDSIAERCVLFEAAVTGYTVPGATNADAYMQIPLSMGSPNAAPIISPDTPTNSVIGDIDIWCDFSAPIAAAGALVSKWNALVGQASYVFQVLSSGILNFVASADGVALTVNVNSTVAVVAPNQRGLYRVTCDVNNGAGGSTTTFYVSYDGGFTWLQVGAAVIGAVLAIFDSTANVQVGSLNLDDNLLISGKVWRAKIFNGIAGQLVMDFDPTRFPVVASGANFAFGIAGEPWLVQNPAVIVNYYTFSVDRKVYIANRGFTSAQWDSPSVKHYDGWLTKIPSYTREMGVALSGIASVGFGNLEVSNPRSAASGPGVRDDWVRMKWRRNYGKLWLGDPSWPKHDFRFIVLGHVGQPLESPMGTISIPLTDISDMLDVPLQSNFFTSGPNINKQKPLAIGYANWVDPPELDPTALTYQLNDGPLENASVGFASIHQILDNGVPLYTTYGSATLPNQISADSAADTLTTGIDHGARNGFLVIFSGSSLPAPFVSNTVYYLLEVGSPAAQRVFQLALTPGGAPINITSLGLSYSVTIYGYSIDYAAGVLTLLRNPAGRISARQVAQGPSSTSRNVAQMLAWTIFAKGRVAPSFKDQASFDVLEAAVSATGFWPEPDAGIYVGMSQVMVRQAVDTIAKGMNLWLGVTPDGLIQVGRLDLPAATAVLTLTESDVMSLTMQSEIRPDDFTQADVSYDQPNLTQGPLLYSEPLAGGGGVNKYFVAKTLAAKYSYGTPAAPLDNYPNITDSRQPRAFDVIVNGVSGGLTERGRLAALLLRTIGIFQFQTRLKATELKIGDTISLTHSRLGWKQWSVADPASPDNTATIDSRLAVVLKTQTDLSVDAFPVTVTVFRPIYGNYPLADLN